MTEKINEKKMPASDCWPAWANFVENCWSETRQVYEWPTSGSIMAGRSPALLHFGLLATNPHPQQSSQDRQR